MPIRPIEIMEKHTYDANKDGVIDLGAIPNTLTGKDADTVDGKNPGSASGLATLDAGSVVVQQPPAIDAAKVTSGRFGMTRLNFADISLVNLLSNGDFEVGDPPTGWTLGGAGATFARSSVQVKTGTYSGLLTRVGNDCNIQAGIANFAYYKGRKVTAGYWVYATVASRARVSIYDGVQNSYSSFHSGVAGWEWLTVTRTMDAAASTFLTNARIEGGDTSAYFDGAILVEGDTCPAFSDKPLPLDQKAAASGVASLDASSVVVQQPPAIDAAKVTSGRFGVARMPDGTSGLVLTAQGAGADPAYAAPATLTDIIVWAMSL